VRRAGALAAGLTVLALIASAGYLALQSVYFIGTNDRGLVTLYQGVPFRLPGNLALYSSRYVSGVSASTLASQRRQTLLDHSLRSESSAASLIRSLEVGQLE
jgi:protein phosphatase